MPHLYRVYLVTNSCLAIHDLMLRINTTTSGMSFCVGICPRASDRCFYVQIWRRLLNNQATRQETNPIEVPVPDLANMGSVGRVFELNSGATIPAVGFGTAALPQKEQMIAAVARALEVGYRHFDTASIYRTEPALGEALNKAFQDGVVRRDEVFVTTKLFAGDHEDPVSALKTSLKNLKLEYLDLYLIHWPINLKKGASHPIPKEDEFLPLDIKSIWRGMEQGVELGLTKSIGLSNFSCKKIEDLLSYAKIPPAVNQVEMHPLWQQKKLRDYCNKVKIHVSAWSPLGGFGTFYGSNAVMENPIIHEIAKEHGKTIAQVLLRWGLEQGVSVLPKSYNKDRIAENFQIFDWSLTVEDHEKIGKIEQKKLVRREELINSTTSPYKTIEELWDGEI